MEIRRKVFSILEDENGEERIYSTSEIEMFYDEETGEKMFAEAEDDKKGMSTGAKVGLGAGAAATAWGGLTLASLLKKRRLTPEQKKALEGMLKANGGDKKAKYVKDQVKYWRSANKATQKGIGFVDKVNETVFVKPGQWVGKKVSGIFKKKGKVGAEGAANAAAAAPKA